MEINFNIYIYKIKFSWYYNNLILIFYVIIYISIFFDEMKIQYYF